MSTRTSRYLVSRIAVIKVRNFLFFAVAATLVFPLAANSAGAQTSANSPQSAQASHADATVDEPAPSAQPLAGLRSQVEARVAAGRYPGAVFAVAHGDKLLVLDAVGTSDLATRTPMRSDTIFRTMSMTKPFTAAAAMILVEEGKLALDDPIGTVLPEFAGYGASPASAITLRQLLTHTSGLDKDEYPVPLMSLQQRVKATAAKPVAAPAGSRWAYSGILGPDVIARMIEVAAKEPFEHFVKRRIFDPLAMKDTGWQLTPSQGERLTGLYQAEGGKIQQVPMLAIVPDQPAGGYGVYSTAPDYLRFALMLAGDGSLNGVRVLSEASVKEMRSAQVPLGFPGLPPGLEGGFLMRRIGDPVSSGSSLARGTYGWSGAFGTHFWIDPGTGLVAVWMINLVNAGGAGSPDAADFERMVTQACTVDIGCW